MTTAALYEQGPLAGLRHRLTNYAFGSHLVDWLALVVLVVLALAIRICARRFFSWLLIRKRGKSQREYWRIHDR
jgi:hypothetical protein